MATEDGHESVSSNHYLNNNIDYYPRDLITYSTSWSAMRMVTLPMFRLNDGPILKNKHKYS